MEDAMALALLELTHTSDGDVLEQLLVTTAEAAARQHRALGSALNRIHLYTHMDSALPGVPHCVRLKLESTAVSCLAQLARYRCNAANAASAPLVVAWHAGQLSGLRSHSMAVSLELWSQQIRPAGDSVLIEIIDPAPVAVAALVRNLERHYARLRDGIDHEALFHHPTKSIMDLQPRDAVDAVSRRNAPGTRVEQMLHASNAHRETLATQWLVAAQVGTILGCSFPEAGQHASQLRRAGQLLGVYVMHPAPSYRYPIWQFQPCGRPVDQLTEILAVLREFGPFERELHGMHRTTGWGEVEWFLSPHALLNGAAPAQVLATDPAAVLQAANGEFRAS